MSKNVREATLPNGIGGKWTVVPRLGEAKFERKREEHIPLKSYNSQIIDMECYYSEQMPVR